MTGDMGVGLLSAGRRAGPVGWQFVIVELHVLASTPSTEILVADLVLAEALFELVRISWAAAGGVTQASGQQQLVL
jgi:hypothetical protein